jgi:hypothetical protein
VTLLIRMFVFKSKECDAPYRSVVVITLDLLKLKMIQPAIAIY